MTRVEELQQFLKEDENHILNAASELLEKEMPKLTEELFSLYETTGNRILYENEYFIRRKFLATFGMAVLINREKKALSQARLVAKLEAIMKEICEEECWALPAHVNRVSDENWRITVDLFSSETAQTLSEYRSLLEEELSEEVKNTIAQNVIKRVLNPYYQSSFPYASWETCETNWNAVCLGSIGSASMYLMEKGEELEQCLDRICHSITHYVDGFEEDGTCLEGLSYFTYGMTYYIGFMEQLYRHSEGKKDYFQQEKLEKMACFQQKCYFNESLSVCFSDGNDKDRFRVGLTSMLAMKYKNCEFPPMKLAADFNAEYCYRSMGLYRDYAWTKEYLAFLEKEEKRSLEQTEDSLCTTHQYVLPDAQWSIYQAKNSVGCAIKGGHNAEPHNHNDIGSFFYCIEDEMFLADLGAGEYTKQYFGEDRYEILCNRTLGHNVLLINGKEQEAGDSFRAESFRTEEPYKTVISFASAYESGLLTSLQRTFQCNEESGVVEVTDSFTRSNQTMSITENLITDKKVRIENHTIFLEGEKHNCMISIKECETEIQLIKEIHMDHYGAPKEVTLMQWDVPLHQNKCTFIVSPVDK